MNIGAGEITLIALAVIAVYAITIYNHLVALKNQFKNSFAQIDVQLQRRYDLIPNLVETAKSYMAFEQKTFTMIIEARNQAKQAASAAAQQPGDPSCMQTLNSAETGLTRSLGGFFALVENYPDLKANQTMHQLMEELTSTENKISFARQAFNDSIMTYNTYRTQFPPVIVANLLKFGDAQHFEVIDDKAKDAIKVAL